MRFQPAAHVRGTTFAVLAGLTRSLSVLCCTYALTHGESSIVVTMTALYPLISIGLSIVRLKETLTPRQGIGIIRGALALLLFAT